MNRESIAQAFREYLLHEFPNQSVELSEHTNLLKDWFIDSLGLIETIMFIERTYGIVVSRGDITADNFETIEVLSKYVENRLAKML